MFEHCRQGPVPGQDQTETGVKCLQIRREGLSDAISSHAAGSVGRGLGSGSGLGNGFFLREFFVFREFVRHRQIQVTDSLGLQQLLDGATA